MLITINYKDDYKDENNHDVIEVDHEDINKVYDKVLAMSDNRRKIEKIEVLQTKWININELLES